MSPAGIAGLAVFLALVGAPAAAHPRNEAPMQTLPGWAREAMELRLPSTQAAAVLALDERVVEPLESGGVRETRRLAVKVLSPAGLKRHGEDVLSYRQDDRILAYRVWTVSPQGTVRRSDDEDDVQDYPAIPGNSGYTDVRMRVVRVPGLEVAGWKISEAVVVNALDLGAPAHSLGDLYEPTVVSRVVVRTPPGWSRAWVARRASDMKPDLGPEEAGFTLRDLAPAVQEPLGPVPRDLLPVVWVRWRSPDGTRGYGGWADVARWAGTLSEPVLSDVGAAAARAAALRPAGEGDFLPALRAAFEHCARDVRYVSIQLGIGGFRPETPGRVESKLYGDCKAKATLMRALLQAWGLRTFSVLVATRGYGEVDPDVPTPAQFNHMIAAVLLPPEVESPWATLDVPSLGRLLFLDPTDSQADALELPEEVQGSLALLVHPDAPQLLRLPTQPSAMAAESRTLRGTLDAGGALVEAEVETRYAGTRAAEWRWRHAGATEQERRETMAREIQRLVPNAAVSSYAVEGSSAFTSPVCEKLRLRGGKVARRTGSLLVVEPGRLAARPLDPLPALPRRWPLHLGAPRRFEIAVELTGPSGQMPEELPPPASLRTSVLSGEARWAFDDGRLVYQRTVDLSGGVVSPADYAAFREALLTVQGWDATGIVLAPPD